MLEDMAMRSLRKDTQRDYSRAARYFAQRPRFIPIG
jgi:hypothetical protein